MSSKYVSQKRGAWVRAGLMHSSEVFRVELTRVATSHSCRWLVSKGR